MKILLLFLLLPLGLGAVNLTYNYDKEGEISQALISIEKSSSGKLYSFTMLNNGGEIVKGSMETNRDGKLLNYNYDSTGYHSKGNRLFTRDGKEVEDVDLSKETWLQDNTVMDFWINSDEKEIKYFIIGPKYDKKGNLVPGENAKMGLLMKKKGKEKIKVGGRDTECIKVLYTTQDGFLSLFWRNTLWYRINDGVLVYGEMKEGGPGSKTIIVKLASEE